MPKKPTLKHLLFSTTAILVAQAATAATFNVPAGSLEAALDAYSAQSGISVVVANKEIQGVQTRGVVGDLSVDEALGRILKGTGFVKRRDPSGTIGIVRQDRSSNLEMVQPLQLAQASPPRQAVETVTVTSSKLGGADVQSIPIAITALSQEQLTATQTAGGPDLVKQVPNLTFTKTNFTGYSIQIRGIGTQAISVTTDPAVAVAFNDQPFIRNHFFEQEFYDVSQVAVLRGPQGTLYGRNATAGVVNLTSARPTDQFEAMASAELGNYHQRRFEGMVNLPIVDDRLDIRIAGEWTKRQGYSFNETTQKRIDGRDLWSGRVTVGLKPIEGLQAYLIWEHFSENDDRMRSSKQLCKTDTSYLSQAGQSIYTAGNYLNQGCVAASMYSPEAFQVPYGPSLPYVAALFCCTFGNEDADVFLSDTQSRNLRVIQSALDPAYKVKNDIVELNADWVISPNLTFTSQTSFNNDFLWGTQDYNRFNMGPGVFAPSVCCQDSHGSAINSVGAVDANGVFCDPQLGCADRIVAQDLSTARSWQLGQEFRLASNFSGPLNFSLGGNYLHYETFEKYYVFINAVTLFSTSPPFPQSMAATYHWIPGVSDNHECLQPAGLRYSDPHTPPPNSLQNCGYIDPNPIGSLNDQGHNYFLSQNPYVLNSYATFGEVYYNLAKDLKLTGGLRWTEDRKHFVQIPSWIAAAGYGYPVAGTVDQQWDQFTGRFNATWTPNLNFTDQTLLYASYSHGYKAGGANPPGAMIVGYAVFSGIEPLPTHPLTFEPEFVNAFEIGTKNTLLDGALTFNVSSFYYDYRGYQISEIVDRTSINLNFDAKVKGAEIETTWEPVPGLRFNFAGGWEDTKLARGSHAIDLIDRTGGDPNWHIVRPFITSASNCILPTYVVNALSAQSNATSACADAYHGNFDPVTKAPYVANPTEGNGPGIPAGYIGFDPATAPNQGQGIFKDISGNELPNAPPFTVSVGAQYSMPLSSDWAGTARGDFYWQDASWARVFNSDPYDRIHGYKNFNLALIFTSQSGWQVMLYDKNVFNTTAITGAFLNSDDSDLTTNVFLTDPKLIGVRVTKNW